MRMRFREKILWQEFIMKLLKQLEKFLKGNTLIALVGFLVLLIAMRQFSKNKTSNVSAHAPSTFSKAPEGAEESEGLPQPAEIGAPTNVTDLLPNDATITNGPNMLKAGASIGMVSQCSRNPNLQIRAEPPNPKGEGPRTESVIEHIPTSGLSDF